jgi:5S rRNA maturation endonuclease (ribonuclease M5)
LKNKRADQVLPGSKGWDRAGRKVAQTIYTHMSKFKNNKIKNFFNITKTNKKKRGNANLAASLKH